MAVFPLNSATPTKIRAMQAKLLQADDFAGLSAAENLRDMVQLLDEYESYHSVFQGLNPDAARRQDLEKILYRKLLYDYDKIYRFSGGRFRKFLQLYFMHFEISMLKRFLRDCVNARSSRDTWEVFGTYFRKYSKLPFESLVDCMDITAFIYALQGSIYHLPLSKIEEGSPLFAYESAMDLLYFKTVCESIKRCFGKKELLWLKRILGTKIDLLNIQWIYRAKKYYQMDDLQLYRLLIPLFYHVKSEDVKALVRAASMEDFEQLLQISYYGRLRKKKFADSPNPEAFADALLSHLLMQASKEEPKSVLLLYAYLFRREVEIERLIRLIESIRYGIPKKGLLSDF